MKRAIVVGADGQDGRLITERLERDKCETIRIGRNHVISREGTSEAIDVSCSEAIAELVEHARPDAIFFLAAVHHSSEAAPPPDAELLTESWKVNVAGPANFLDALARHAPRSAFFYAASSLVYGIPTGDVQNEETPFSPDSIYGITKTAGIHVCRYYRQSKDIRASAGILYNHESPYRREGFISRRIVSGAVRISRGQVDCLTVGDMTALIDWGYAPDHVDAMIRIAKLQEAGDFIIATGEAHTVGEFVEIAFARLGLDWRKYIQTDPSRLTRRSSTRIGDYSKLRSATGWKPTVTFREMVEILVDAELARNAG